MNNRYNYFILSITCILFINVVDGQEYFSKRWDAGGTNFHDRIKTSVVLDDTLYYVSFNVCNYTDTTATVCNVVGKMDKEGAVLKETLFNWLSIVSDTKAIAIDEDRLIIADGIYSFGKPSISLLILDRFTLDSIQEYQYYLGREVDFYAASAVIAFDDYYIVSGWSRLVDWSEWPDWCLWVDKNTMELDTIISYPYQKKGAKFEYLFVGEDSLLTVFFAGLGLFTNVNDITLNSRGFLKYNREKEVVFYTRDTIDHSIGLVYHHTALLQKNGKMVYKQPHNKDHNLPTVNAANFEIIGLDGQGKINWRFHDPGWHPYGKKYVYSLFETKEGDIIGCGNIAWGWNLKQLFEWNYVDTIPDPDYENYLVDTVDKYEAPYIFKLNGETGEMIWQYILLELDENGNVGPVYLKDIHELSDGSLFGMGGYTVRNEEGEIEQYDSWAIRLPANVCKNETMECKFQNLLTATKDIILVDINQHSLFLMYPNPSSDILYIYQPYPERVRYELYDIAGQLVYRTKSDVMEHTFAIDVSSYQSGVYFMQIYGRDGRLLETKRFVKQ